MAAALEEGGAARQAGRGCLIVAAAGFAVFQRAADALESLVENEVHDARDGVRAVGGGRTTRNDFGALQERQRNHVGVDGCLRRGRRKSLSVYQHECADGPHATQVQDAPADVVRGRTETRGCRCVRGPESGDLVEEAPDVGSGALLDPVSADDAHRSGGFEAASRDARAGHDDTLECFLGTRVGGANDLQQSQAGVRVVTPWWTPPRGGRCDRWAERVGQNRMPTCALKVRGTPKMFPIVLYVTGLAGSVPLEP